MWIHAEEAYSRPAVRLLADENIAAPLVRCCGCGGSIVRMVINSSSLLVCGHLRMDFSDQGNFTMPGRWTRELKDWSQIFYQFALGAAGLKVLSDL